MVNMGVFEREGADAMSRNAFYLALGVILTWGFGLSAYLSTLTATWQPSLVMILVVGLAVPIAGIVLSAVSSNPVLSFAGFNMVAGGFGLLLGPVLAMYKVAYPGVVTEAALLTAGITALMALSGLTFPNFYSKIGGALFMALICVVLVSVAGLFIPALANLTIFHYAAAAVFALYIGYDMWRASEIPATLDNAVDVAVSLYLDILNLFLQILKILAESKK